MDKLIFTMNILGEIIITDPEGHPGMKLIKTDKRVIGGVLFTAEELGRKYWTEWVSLDPWDHN